MLNTGRGFAALWCDSRELTMAATTEQIKDEVVKVARDGATAQKLVTTVSSQAGVESVVVQRVLRSMLEKGAIVLDTNMNLVLPK
jgi:hypothetical protein